MCCSDPPPPPDLGPQAEASTEIARMQQETAQHQLEWAQQQDSMNREVLNRVLDVQLPAMQDQAEAAKRDRARYEQLFQPLEENLVKEFQNYDTPERRQREQAKAIADVTSTFDASRRNALQRLEGYGVDPSQTRNAALDVGVRTQQAAAQAAAATAAGQRVADVGRSLRAEAINIGRGLPSQVAGAYQTALQAGQGAVGGATSTTAAGAGASQTAVPFFQGAQQGYSSSAGIQNMAYGNQMQNYQAGVNERNSWLNAAAGVAGMAIADGGNIKTQAIPFMADGHVDTGMGDGSGIDDTVPARISDGEYVIPADVVRAKGTEFFDKLLERYHTPAEQQRALGVA